MTAKLKVATREAILAAEDRVTEWVDVPEWHLRVLVRSLEVIERYRLEGSFVKYGKVGGRIEADFNVAAQDVVRARLCAMACIDEAGANLFTEADILILTHKNAAALDRIFVVAQRLSGLTDKDVEALKSQLGEDPSSSSGSD